MDERTIEPGGIDGQSVRAELRQGQGVYILIRPCKGVPMTVRLSIAVLLFMMIQGVFFGIGVILVLATPLKAQAMQLLPVVVVSTAVLALPVSWWLAPRLRARFWRNRRRDGWADKVLDSLS